MFFKLLTLSALFIYCSSSQTINETVSEQNVTKREANVGDLFPDWVPFKNKHGDELGDFVQVQKKSKVKKRLAPPVNFILRAVAEEGEEYYDKGAGESDSDDYFEKKDWSDLHRPVQESDKKKAPLNHTDISDIDGVVEIIKKGPPEPIAAALESAKKEIDEKRKQRQKALESEIIEGDDDVKSTEATDGKKARASEEDGEDYDEENTEKPKPSSAEIKESEAKKAKILSSVDELKERHAEEQRHINDRLKEEDLYKDQHRGKVFEGSFEERDRPERRPRLKNRKPTTKPDYDEYEDLNGSLEDKYKINILKTVSPAEPKEKIKITKETTTSLPRVSKLVQSGKLSVFKNPSLYMVLDDEDEPTSTPSSTAVYTRGTQKFSSRFTTTPATNTEDDRISLVPVESKEGEPTLFFPKRRKNRRKTIRMTTPSEIDSSVAETVTDNYKQTTAFDTTASDTVQSDTTAPESSSESTTETLTTASDFGTDFASADTVTDAVPASSDHKKEKEKHTDYHNRRGELTFEIYANLAAPLVLPPDAEDDDTK